MPGPGIDNGNRVTFQLTIVAGVVQHIADPDAANPVWGEQLYIQARANQAPGIGYVLCGKKPSDVLSAATASQLVSEIGASPSAVQPGGSFVNPPGVGAGGFNQRAPEDMRCWGLDASANGVYIVSYFRRN